MVQLTFDNRFKPHYLIGSRTSFCTPLAPERASDEAATKYLLDHQEKVSLLQDIYLLERLVPFIYRQADAGSDSRWNAGISYINDLRHTVGMRLREAGAREETIADILWHT